MRLVLFFSFEISLEEWLEVGILDREIRLYQELGKRYGMTFQFLTYGGEADRKCSRKIGEIQVLPVYKSRPSGHGRFGRLLMSLCLPWRLSEDLIAGDIFKSNQMMGAWVGVISKLRFGKPLLVRTGYELSEFLRLGGAPWWHKAGGWVLSYASYRLADRIHVATRDDKKILEKRFRVPAYKVHVQPNWIDAQAFSPPYREDEREDTVLFVGRFAEQKNLPLLIDAISGTDLSLTIVGSGPDEKKVREQIKVTGIEAKIMTGIPNSSMPALYQRCAIYVICSRFEGNPKTLLEAMACGCAVIGTNVKGVKELIQHEKNGILVEEDVSSLRDAILSLISNPSHRFHLGKAARESVLRHHSLEAAVEAEWYAYSALTSKAEREKLL